MIRFPAPRTFTPAECLSRAASAWIMDVEGELWWLEHDETFMAEHGDQLRELRMAGATFAERLEALTAHFNPGFGFVRESFSGQTDEHGNASFTFQPSPPPEPEQ